jgi:hypothetical protein
MGISLLASTGPWTGMLEAIATAVGCGTVIGGFAAGLVDIALGRPRAPLDRQIMIGSYVGGLVGLFLLVVDIVGKRFV